jgi:hypothetical protein
MKSSKGRLARISAEAAVISALFPGRGYMESEARRWYWTRLVEALMKSEPL